MDNFACSTSVYLPPLSCLKDGSPYPSISRPQGVLATTHFAYIQRREAAQQLQAIVEECRRRYVYSRRVTGAPDPSFGTGTLMVDLTALVYPWDRLCCWYRETVFRRQMDLFECPYQTELTRWKTLVLERCLEPIYDDPQRVRLILATVGLIPSMYADFELYEDLEEGDPEPIFGWVMEDHDRRAWGT